MIPYSMNPMGVGQYYTDLDILRQIRDANPTSQLPALWLDTENPYTQWEGVMWNSYNTNCIELNIGSKNVSTLHNIKNLTHLNRLVCPNNLLTGLDVSNMPLLGYLNCGINSISILNIAGSNAIYHLQAWNNKLTDIDLSEIQDKLMVLELDHNLFTFIPSLTYKNSLYTYYDFRSNYMTTDADRLIALGFSSAYVLPQNP